MSKEKIDKQLEREKQKEIKKMKVARTEKANELKEIKDSVVIDKSLKFYGVLSYDKKNPENSKYYAVSQKPNNGKYMCDCKDFSIKIDFNADHECKHIIRLDNAIKTKEKIRIVDLVGLKLLKSESL